MLKKQTLCREALSYITKYRCIVYQKDRVSQNHETFNYGTLLHISTVYVSDSTLNKAIIC